MAALAPAYTPRRPTESVLYGLVRQNLEPFLAHARGHYDGGLPRYVEAELRAYLRCGDFSEGFTRARCDTCGHDLLIAFTCKSRSVCPSCCGRRMANLASHLVDRVLPDVPLRQFVLSLPYELRRLAAFKADVLTALGGIFVEAVFANYRSRAKRRGLEGVQCGAVNFVQRFGSLNLNVHFHVAALDGVFTRDPEAGVLFHPAAAPTTADLDAIVRRVQRRSTAWLRRHGYLDERELEDRSNEPPPQTALEVCAALAMGRGQVATLPRTDVVDAQADDHEQPPEKTTAAVENDGFNLHAGVRIDAGDDLGRERLCRYGARPPLSLERLRRLPGGRVSYRLKYVDRGRKAKHRVMSGLEFMARLSAIICPPRYPLLRYAGVLAPRSAWRGEVVPKPRGPQPACKGSGASNRSRELPQGKAPEPLRANEEQDRPPSSGSSSGSHSVGQAPPPRAAAGPLAPESAARVAAPVRRTTSELERVAPGPGDVIRLSPNIISVRHWDRLLGGVLYAATPRVDWARLLRRSLDVDALQCPKCHGRLRVLAVITEREPVRRILAHLGLPTDAPPLARARDPADDADEVESSGQLELGLM